MPWHCWGSEALAALTVGWGTHLRPEPGQWGAVHAVNVEPVLLQLWAVRQEPKM